MMFKKKLITSAVASAAILSLASVALADGGTVADNDSALYVGGQAGYGATHWGSVRRNLTDKVTGDNGVASRFFAGYDVNRYLAAETGFAWFFNDPKVKSSGNRNFLTVDKTFAVDAVAKAKAPLSFIPGGYGDDFDIYGKGGLGVLFSNDKTGDYVKSGSSTPQGSFLFQKSTTTLGPVFGFGAEYNLSIASLQNLTADVSWTRYSGSMNSPNLHNNYTPSADFIAGGLAYKFNI